MSLLAVGTVAFDDVETPTGRAEKIVGGAATYISLSASHFVQPVNVVSVIGDDFPQDTLQLMQQKGINLEGLQIRPGEKSFFWAGRYHDDLNSRDTLETQLNVLADFDPVLPASYLSSRFVMLGNLTPSVQMRVIEQLNGTQRFVAMDTMNFWMKSAMDSLLEVLKKVNCLIINDEEARQLSGHHSIVKAAHQILALGPECLVIKKGEHGALLFYGDQIFFAPALPLAEVFDPTGAGDTFAGGFMGYLAKTGEISFDNMKKAVIVGSVLASFCVERFGIERLQSLRLEEIKSRVKKFEELVHFGTPL